MAMLPRCGAGSVDSSPWKEPMGVLAAATITTSLIISNFELYPGRVTNVRRARRAARLFGQSRRSVYLILHEPASPPSAPSAPSRPSSGSASLPDVVAPVAGDVPPAA